MGAHTCWYYLQCLWRNYPIIWCSKILPSYYVTAIAHMLVSFQSKLKLFRPLALPHPKVLVFRVLKLGTQHRKRKMVKNEHWKHENWTIFLRKVEAPIKTDDCNFTTNGFLCVDSRRSLKRGKWFHKKKLMRMYKTTVWKQRSFLHSELKILLHNM